MNHAADSTTFAIAMTKDAVWKSVPPFLIVLGSIGNILSIFILSRENLRHSTSAIYLKFLSISDIAALYTGLLRQWVLAQFDADIRHMGTAVCKIHTWLVYFSLDFSAWLLAALTVDRVITVLLPFKAKSICTKKASVEIILIMGVSLLVANSHILYGMGDIDCASIYGEAIAMCYSSKHHDKCIDTFIKNRECRLNVTATIKCTYINEYYGYFFEEVWPWLDLLLYCFLPFTVLLLGNSAIIWKVSRSNRIEATTEPAAVATANGETGNMRQEDKNKKISSMSATLISINTFFLISASPICVFLIGSTHWYESAKSQKQEELLNLVWAVVNILMYTNNTFNFFFYVLSGSKFRKEVKEQFWKLIGTMTPTTAQEQRMERMRRIPRQSRHTMNLTEASPQRPYRISILNSDAQGDHFANG